MSHTYYSPAGAVNDSMKLLLAKEHQMELESAKRKLLLFTDGEHSALVAFSPNMACVARSSQKFNWHEAETVCVVEISKSLASAFKGAMSDPLSDAVLVVSDEEGLPVNVGVGGVILQAPRVAPERSEDVALLIKRLFAEGVYEDNFAGIPVLSTSILKFVSSLTKPKQELNYLQFASVKGAKHWIQAIVPSWYGAGRFLIFAAGMFDHEQLAGQPV